MKNSSIHSKLKPDPRLLINSLQVSEPGKFALWCIRLDFRRATAIGGYAIFLKVINNITRNGLHEEK